MAKWAVFDVDGTLLPKTSMEKWFITYAAKRRLIPLKNLFYFFSTALNFTLKGNWVNAVKGNKLYLKDLPVDRINKTSLLFFEINIVPALSADGKETIDRYRSQGYKILIMSGSPEFLTLSLENIFHPEKIISTNLETREDRYIGQISGMHLYGKHKTRILKNLQTELEIDFEKSIVFANHHADADHMDLFGEAIAVNPTQKLKSIAEERTWRIEFWA